MLLQSILDMTPTDLAALAAAMGVVPPAEARWVAIDADQYTATAPASTATITFADTTGLGLGRPVRIKQDDTYRYGRIVAVAEDSLLTIAGEPLSAATAIQAVEIGLPEMLAAMPLPLVDGTYGDGITATLIAADTPARVRWPLSAARVVDVELVHVTDDATGNPKVNLSVAGNALSTADSGNGLQVTTSWQSNGVALDTTHNAIAHGDAIELAVTVAGATGDAADLNAILYAVLTD